MTFRNYVRQNCVAARQNVYNVNNDQEVEQPHSKLEELVDKGGIKEKDNENNDRQDKKSVMNKKRIYI
ncbi:hypothetical protein ILUMI_15592, partial [Ignelater luminosus]